MVGVALCSTSSAAPSAPSRVAAADAADQLPPADSVDPQDGYTGVVGLSSSSRVGRAKLNIDVPPSLFAVYNVPAYRKPPNLLRRAPAENLPRRPNPGCDYYIIGLIVDTYAVELDQPDPKRPGVVRRVGVLPTVDVSMLAFGAVPVTARLHVTQVTRNGKVQPLYLDGTGSKLSVPKGERPTTSSPPCDPDWNSSPASPTVVRGQLDIRVSDVKVDGREVPVGDECRTSTPLRVRLLGEPPDLGGEYRGLSDGGALYQQRNTSTVGATNPVPLFPGSTNLTIPEFAGCRAGGGEDVSRLVSGMVSGPDNTLAVRQGYAVLGFFDPAAPSACSDFDGCAVLPDAIRPLLPNR